MEFQTLFNLVSTAATPAAVKTTKVKHRRRDILGALLDRIWEIKDRLLTMNSVSWRAIFSSKTFVMVYFTHDCEKIGGLKHFFLVNIR